MSKWVIICTECESKDVKPEADFYICNACGERFKLEKATLEETGGDFTVIPRPMGCL